MRWLLKPIMRPIARRKLAHLYEEKDRIETAINRARKSKSRVSGLYELAKRTNMECHCWERWI
jgi:ribosomal protein L17